MKFLLASLLTRLIKRGHLKLLDWDGEQRAFGDINAPPVTMHVTDRWAALELVLDPQLKLGELYMDGRVRVQGGTIADLLELFARNVATGYGGGHLEWMARLRFLVRRFMQSNGLARSRRNVAHHYDLSSRLYDLFLDEDKQYSCAFFERPTDTLETAQLNKKRRIAAKLALTPGQRVLDIGSGWGGLALHLARSVGADVTGITLSQEQLRLAQERAEKGGVGGQVRFRLEDYRQTSGRFDRIVSVGMFEHVGLAQYSRFFRKVASLLADDGVALIHTIGRSDRPGFTNPWIAKYIFPGGYMPALSEILPQVERAGLIVTDVEVLRLHYASTLAEWRRRFTARWQEAKALYDERFCRMWEFYLAGAEMGFRHGGLVVFQLQLAKRVEALPIVRDYMTPAALPQHTDELRAARAKRRRAG